MTCTRSEPESLPLENHSSVAQVERRGQGEEEQGGCRGQQEEREQLERLKGEAAIPEPPS